MLGTLKQLNIPLISNQVSSFLDELWVREGIKQKEQHFLDNKAQRGDVDTVSLKFRCILDCF